MRERGEFEGRVPFYRSRKPTAFRMIKKKKKKHRRLEESEKQLGEKTRRGFVSFRRKEIRVHARTSIKGESFIFFFFFLSSRERARFSLKKEEGSGSRGIRLVLEKRMDATKEFRDER